MKRTILLGALIVFVVASSVPALAQNTVTVRITNVSKQIISPPLVATHSWKARVFIPGTAASSELSLLAEDGDPSALAALLGDSDEVLDVKVEDSNLPAFDDFVRREVAKWRFTPPTRLECSRSTGPASSISSMRGSR